MRMPEITDYIRTGFLRGTIQSIVEGRDKGWLDLPYYYVKVVMPAAAAGTIHIVRLDEIRSIQP